MADKNLTAERLRELFHYNKDTGVFTRFVKSSNSLRVAGSIGKDKRIRISVDNHIYRAHTLAWLYVTGEHPKNCIDHINGDASDNRFCNLREATHAENMQNRRSASKNSSTGLLGVSFRKERNKWVAEIMSNRKRIRLGYFATKEMAHDAYLSAKRKLHPFCTV